MLKINRAILQADLATDLSLRQQTVASKPDTADDVWSEFKKVEDERREKKQETVLGTLAPSQKCAYCETSGAMELDHHWPKKPHKRNNQNKGTTSKMFLWDNLVPACHTCNSWACKGSHMQSTPDGRTKLLNPFVIGDDPLCYFDIVVDESQLNGKGSTWQVGWFEIRKDLGGVPYDRAEYTRKRLKLNLRDDLLRGRKNVIRYFLDYVKFLKEFGPDHVIRERRTIRVVFQQMLTHTEPYLAPIRQILRRDTVLRDELFTKMPELKLIVEQWDLEPDDCSTIM